MRQNNFSKESKLIESLLEAKYILWQQKSKKILHALGKLEHTPLLDIYEFIRGAQEILYSCDDPHLKITFPKEAYVNFNHMFFFLNKKCYIYHGNAWCEVNRINGLNITYEIESGILSCNIAFYEELLNKIVFESIRSEQLCINDGAQKISSEDDTQSSLQSINGVLPRYYSLLAKDDYWVIKLEGIYDSSLLEEIERIASSSISTDLLILDLRSCVGGYPSQARELLSYFISEPYTEVHTRLDSYLEPFQEILKTYPKPSTKFKKIIVLQSEHSSSCSEDILIMGLKKSLGNNCISIGTPTANCHHEAQVITFDNYSKLFIPNILHVDENHIPYHSSFNPDVYYLWSIDEFFLRDDMFYQRITDLL